MKTQVIINANRQGYTPEQIRHTMTVGELISALEEYDNDAPIYLSHDNGYTYGGINLYDIEESVSDDESEE